MKILEDGITEAYRTGMPRILHSYEQERRKPKIQISNHVFKITLPNRNADSVIVKESGISLSENEKQVCSCLRSRKKSSKGSGTCR